MNVLSIQDISHFFRVSSPKDLSNKLVIICLSLLLNSNTKFPSISVVNLLQRRYLFYKDTASSQEEKGPAFHRSSVGVSLLVHFILE